MAFKESIKPEKKGHQSLLPGLSTIYPPQATFGLLIHWSINQSYSTIHAHLRIYVSESYWWKIGWMINEIHFFFNISSTNSVSEVSAVEVSTKNLKNCCIHTHNTEVHLSVLLNSSELYNDLLMRLTAGSQFHWPSGRNCNPIASWLVILIHPFPFK